jgi:hypothetical protein
MSLGGVEKGEWNVIHFVEMWTKLSAALYIHTNALCVKAIKKFNRWINDILFCKYRMNGAVGLNNGNG